MNYSLSNMLGGGMVGGLDPSAKGYIAAVTAAGATVTSAQRGYINNFYKSAKADYYTSLKRLYLPIWGVAAANAIDMIGLTSGTFVGGVTHGAGFVQGNGSTGYFDMGVSPLALGFTTASAKLGVLVNVANTNTAATAYYIGSRGSFSDGEESLYQVSGGTNAILGRVPSTTVAVQSISPKNGIIFARRVSVTSFFCGRRNTSGYSEGLEQTTDITLNNISLKNLWVMGLNNDNSLSLPTDAKMGSYFAALGLNLTHSELFTLHLKNLWENCTGLTLP